MSFQKARGGEPWVLPTPLVGYTWHLLASPLSRVLEGWRTSRSSCPALSLSPPAAHQPKYSNQRKGGMGGCD